MEARLALLTERIWDGAGSVVYRRGVCGVKVTRQVRDVVICSARCTQVRREQRLMSIYKRFNTVQVARLPIKKKGLFMSKTGECICLR